MEGRHFRLSSVAHASIKEVVSCRTNSRICGTQKVGTRYQAVVHMYLAYTWFTPTHGFAHGALREKLFSRCRVVHVQCSICCRKMNSLNRKYAPPHTQCRLDSSFWNGSGKHTYGFFFQIVALRKKCLNRGRI